MKYSNKRLILAFYSNSEAASKAFVELRRCDFSPIAIVDPNLKPSTRTIRRRFSGLALQWFTRYPKYVLAGESLVLCETQSSRVANCLASLREFGRPSTFVMRTGSAPQAGTVPSHVDPVVTSEQLEACAFELGKEHSTIATGFRAQHVLEDLREAEVDLEAASRHLVDFVGLEQPLSPAAEWLYDNFHLIREHIAEIRRNLPRRYAEYLPALLDTDESTSLRVFRIARELVRRTDCKLTDANVEEMLAAYQVALPLMMGEIWAFPIMLRLALVEELRRLAVFVALSHDNWERAHFWADRLVQAFRRGHDDLERMLDSLIEDPRGITSGFVAILNEQLHDQESTLVPVQQRLEKELQTALTDIIREEHNQQARTQISISNAIGSLRLLMQLEFTEIFEAVSHVEAVLREDPVGLYPRTSLATRDRCRHAIEELARYSGTEEIQIARLVLQHAVDNKDDTLKGHVGYYLMDQGLATIELAVDCKRPRKQLRLRAVRRHGTSIYLGSIISLTLVLTVLIVAMTAANGNHSWLFITLLGLLALIPTSEFVIQTVNEIIVGLVPPAQLPRMKFDSGIPEEATTLVVVPMMLLTPDSIRDEVDKLETRYLANPDDNIYYSLLSDFTDATAPVMPEDSELLSIAAERVRQVNARYPGNRFMLFHRPRRWSTTEDRWIGWERKRGKLEELNRYLYDGVTPYKQFLYVGELPRQVRFVITLDADTQLPSGTAREMIETIAHPLNQVELTEDGRTRIRGYTIIQPRVSITLPGTTATHFTRLFTNAVGTDPYCQAVSDVYQDLFSEGIYHGKAIYDVRAFHRMLNGRFPEERLLSHDLIEGVHVGVGFASNIELFEKFPYDYQSHSRREHRWIRGDWQIAAWIFRKVPGSDVDRVANPLSIINRWKILDNLRRSLVPVASLTVLLIGWLAPASPLAWTVFIGAALTARAVIDILDRKLMQIRGSPRAAVAPGAEFTRIIAGAALLPHQAWLAVDAIVRVWYRLHVTHAHLLEWETAESAHRSANRNFDQLVGKVRIICLSASLLAVFLFVRDRLYPTLPFVALWIGSPKLLQWIHRPKRRPGRAGLEPDDRIFLRKTARETWRYFDDFVNAENNWLPPDNSQVSLRVEVAPRTSPTNIGLWLTSAISAYDFGYLTPKQLVERCLLTMSTLEKLETHRGHLLNWYDTRTLAPLLPRYVSTVDSGNLKACLWVVQAGIRNLLSMPLLSSSTLRGLMDTLNAARTSLGSGVETDMLVQTLDSLFARRAQAVGVAARIRLATAPARELMGKLRWRFAESGDRAYWLTHLDQQVAAWTEVTDEYLRWMELLTAPPTEFVTPLGEEAVRMRRLALRHSPSLRALANGDIPSVRALLELRTKAEPQMKAQTLWLDELAEEFARAHSNAADFIARAEDLIARIQRLADGMDMGFLYDQDRRLFAIGHRTGEPLDTTSHYDLLASECRLASLVAIANGDVPVEHWLALRRPYVFVDGRQALLSWSGTMFEYLMPALFNNVYENSLLDNACVAAVERQIEYGEEYGIPWGISESAFAALDASQTYQYKANGVPGLGLKRGLEDDLVVSPYSTMLALQFKVRQSIVNLRRLSNLGLSGPMGFYEAIDYTRQRSREGETGVIVYAYMAHHQGMSLMALDNALNRRAMQKRFHSDLRVKAVQYLLYEGVPAAPSFLPPPDSDLAGVRFVTDAEAPTARIFDQNTSTPRCHLLGNGRYSSMVTNSGAGYSRWGDIDITRWRADTTRDQWGSYLYIRDTRSRRIWSSTYHPVGGDQGSCTAAFSADRVEFVRKNRGIECLTEITVSPEDDVEIRRFTITNRWLKTRHLEVTFFSEISLAPHSADRAHPAFSKMFVQTELLPEFETILATRRPRGPHESPPWAALLSSGPPSQPPVEYETDRSAFIGRCNTAANPVGLLRAFGNTAGSVLDPIFAQRRAVVLGPGDRIQLTFAIVAAETRDNIMKLVTKYRSVEHCNRTFELAWTHAQLEFRYLGIGAETSHRFQELGSHMLYPNPRLRAQPGRIRRNVLGQARLWAHGISGDHPIVTVIVTDPRGIPLVREILLAHTYWRLHGFFADLVILNQEAQSYERPLHEQLFKLIQAHSLHTGVNVPGGVFLLSWPHIPDEEITLLLTSSRVVLESSRGLVQHLSRATAVVPETLPFAGRGGPAEEPSPPLPFLELPYFNGLGGFSRDGRQYSIYLAPGQTTPLPWINVMANPQFGLTVSESGSTVTWSENSQTNRLTPWHNDPVSDHAGEAIYVRDEDTGLFWTPTAIPIREPEAYRANHGAGYTIFEHNSHGIEQTLLMFVPVSESESPPVRVHRLRLKNSSSRKRRLTVTTYSEWTLGTDREDTQLFITTEWDSDWKALFARNPHHPDYSHRVAFATLIPRASTYTADRTGFLGRNGSYTRPTGLEHQTLSMRCGVGFDPCAALRTAVELEPGEQKDVVYLFGEASGIEPAARLVEKYQDGAVIERAYQETRDYWEKFLTAVQVKTPILSVDFLMNRWLIYQTLTCRVWGRSALYQSGGAFGYRDQLQDVIALLYADPSLARRHILLAASRQFVEGDVQHWWHPPSGAGIRSRCSDDLLWLPYATSEYVRITDDIHVLESPVSFLAGPLLKDGEHEAYFVPAESNEKASLFEHCRRAIDRSLAFGPHGLPLIGTGDWNDGMNSVGDEGKGESVWLAFFLIEVLRRFCDLCEQFGKHSFIDRYRGHMERIAAAIDRSAWDGEWYLRAYFDDGSPLGSNSSTEAKIDSLPQSWSVISDVGDKNRSHRAMRAVETYLVREADRLVLLFSPPFDHSEPHPGYIQGYPPGIRENGGQYSHAALWVAQALARLGDGEKAVKTLQMLNPIELSRVPAQVARYQGEPYAVAADVYASKGRVGRCGWSWYTGSAGWMYRVWLEDVLGFYLSGDMLTLRPAIPTDWPEYKLSYRYRTSLYEITVKNTAPQREEILEVDGKRQTGRAFRLVDDGKTHVVRLQLGTPQMSQEPKRELSTTI